MKPRQMDTVAASEAGVLLLRQMSEAEFMASVVDAAQKLSWRCFHDYDSRRSNPGWPDLVCVRDGKLLALELKAKKGRVRPGQIEWIAELADVPGVTALIARPDDWDQVLALLRGDVA